MADNRRRTQALAAAPKKIRTLDHGEILFWPTETLGRWYALLMFLEEPAGRDSSPFSGGEYLFEMRAPTTYPATPPIFTALTPNGVYKPNSAICVSVGTFHADAWRKYKSMGMAGFASNAIHNGLVCYGSLGEGIGLQATNLEQKRGLARRSQKFNRSRYPKIMAELAGVARREAEALRAAKTFLRMTGDDSGGFPREDKYLVESGGALVRFVRLCGL